jgi:hypothetical protein
MNSFNRDTKEFLKWLSKNSFTIYDPNIFNDFAIIFKKDIRISEISKAVFVTKDPFGPFVLQFVEVLLGYDMFQEKAIQLVENGIIYVLVHNMHTIKSEDVPSALLIKSDRLKDRTYTFKEGNRSVKFYFEDVLWQRRLCLDTPQK